MPSFSSSLAAVAASSVEPTPSILFVDDEPSVTENLKLALRRQPYAIFTANSGREALEVLRTHQIDAVVSDEMMPEMSGSELLSLVAQESPDTARIILSGHASLDAAIRAINEARIFRFLQKPCSPSDLIACLESAVAARKQALAARTPLMQVSPRLAGDFERALDSLWMAVQPVVRPRVRRIAALEALVRSDSSEMANPAALFDAADRLGRILELEYRIRQRVGEAAARLPAEAMLFVNLHPQTLTDDRLFSPEDPLAPHAARVVLEITERASLEDIDAVDRRIAALRRIGFRIAIDDLGAGYSGLSSFAVLQPDFVKFDMGLVRNVHQTRTNARVIASMVQLGRELGFETIAEGVETEAELRELETLGCELFQGYLLARPAREVPHIAWPE